GIASIIAGLAAQSILGNLVAGIQLAFTDAVRVGDVVVVQGEWGTIGEINLSYVVVYIWDERRLVVPCSYFTSNSIETWTRHSDQILGTVFLDLDWRVPMDAVRAKFDEIIEASPAWDHRSSSVVVTDAQGGTVTVRFVMSAKDSSDQWTLRCDVREQMV
ncbi:mechanosensitive ion channel family protein, partial [Polaribacter sp. DS7-9]|nr:mechanosensitive ion channel family protein [Polaribacter sp. DS7-9]